MKRSSTRVIAACVAILTMAWGVSPKPITGSRASAGPIRFAQEPHTLHHDAAGIQFDVPKGWKTKEDGDTLTVSSADGALQIVIWIPSEDGFDAAVKALDKELGKTIKNQKPTGEAQKDTHNGMPHYGQSGTGEVDGTTIEWSVDVLAAKKPVIILTFAAPELLEKHANSYTEFVKSIKKIDEN